MAAPRVGVAFKAAQLYHSGDRVIRLCNMTNHLAGGPPAKLSWG